MALATYAAVGGLQHVTRHLSIECHHEELMAYYETPARQAADLV